MPDGRMLVGLDVHKRSIAIATISRSGQEGTPTDIPNDPATLLKQLRGLGPATDLRVCSGAGPCGYAIHRLLTQRGIACLVAAPSLIPRQPGNRVKTDRRDAAKLARLLRSGDLAAVAAPTPETEAIRDLSRERARALGDLHRVRQRLIKYLTRQGITEPSGGRYTRAWWSWVQGLVVPLPAPQRLRDDLCAAIAAAQARLDRLTQAVVAHAATGPLAPLAAALQQLHGVAALTAVGILVEVGDLTRFDDPHALMAYAGLVPSEHSSGARTQRGRITKTGNPHLRRLVVEAAWHYTRPLPADAPLPTERVARIAAVARKRLHRRYWRFVSGGKERQLAIVAIARALLGVLWAVAQPSASAA